MIVHLLTEAPALLHTVAHFASTAPGPADLAAPGIPDPGPVAPPGADKVLLLLGWLKWLFTAAAVGGLTWAGIGMVRAHRHGDDTKMAHLGYVALACVVVGAGAQILGQLV